MQNSACNIRMERIEEQLAVTTREFNHEESAALARQLQVLFKHWRLSPAQQLTLLGARESADAAPADIVWPAYLSGEGLMRAWHLLVIHASLRTLFPANPELVYDWMQTPNKAFGGATPLALIGASGLAGILTIQNYLQHALGQ